MLDQRFFANIDWVLCFLVLLICGVGLIALSSATVGTPGQEDYLIQQVFRILAGIGVIILVQLVHYRNWAPGFCYASGSNWVAGSRAVLWNRWTWSTCTTLAESWAVFFPTF